MSYALTGFEGKVALVTGAGRMRSIGRPIAVELARAGCDVVLVGTGRDPATYPADEQAAGWRDIESVADEIRALGRTAVPVVADVADPEAVDALAEQVLDQFGRIDILVNNAGAARSGDRVALTELSLEDWHRVLHTNLDGTFYMCRCFAPHLQRSGGGSIINISTLGARLLAANTGAYATSKLAINGLTSVLAKELGPQQIRVNAVAPGIVDTSRLDDIPRGEPWEQLIENYIPLRRAGTGNDIAHAVVFLCSDQGSWISGQHLYVDGGQG